MVADSESEVKTANSKWWETYDQFFLFFFLMQYLVFLLILRKISRVKKTIILHRKIPFNNLLHPLPLKLSCTPKVTYHAFNVTEKKYA